MGEYLVALPGDFLYKVAFFPSALRKTSTMAEEIQLHKHFAPMLQRRARNT
jgi:hypothetical protein